MSKEGSLDAPIRHPIDFEHPDFLNPEKLDAEMRRAFDICHGCRRCFNLCDSFPKLFDMIDESENEDVESLKSEQFEPVVDACTLCDMCFMTKCPYVPPHDFDLDFPHLMLRYRTAQKKLGKLPSVPTQLAQIDRNAKIGVMFSKLVNWASSVKNKFFRKILEIVAGIDKRVQQFTVIPRSLKSLISLWNFLQYPQSTSVKIVTLYFSFSDLKLIKSSFDKTSSRILLRFKFTSSLVVFCSVFPLTAYSSP